MNAQGETWTAERVLNYLCDGIDLKVVGEAAFMHQALKQALAIVRLHPELIATATEAENLMRGIEGMSRNNIEQMAHEVGEKLRDLLARAHALGDNRG